MKKERENKQIVMLLIFAVVVMIFAKEFLLSNATVDFELQITSQENGQMQLYFYSGNDYAPNDEMHSIMTDFSASSERQAMHFTLPMARLRDIRLDIDGAQKILIQGITLTCMGKQVQVGLDLSMMKANCELSDAGDWIQFESRGDDPQLIFGDMRFYDQNVLYISLAIAVAVTLLLGAFLRSIKVRSLADRYYRYSFLFEELVKRDFKKKYKRTVLGMLWSMLTPLLTLLVMWVVFSRFFGQTMNHYVIFLFAGNVVFSFFSEATGVGMNSLISNSGIFTKVNVPKYMFLLSQSVTSVINFGLTLIIFFLFVAIEGIPFTWAYVCLLYPIVCLLAFNIGVGMILSAMYVFFRDIEYLWNVFTMLLMYLSAIFYNIDGFSQNTQYLFLLNPVYVYIRYFRKIVLEGIVPSPWFHLLAVGYAFLAIGIGCFVYKKYNTKFLYYV